MAYQKAYFSDRNKIFRNYVNRLRNLVSNSKFVTKYQIYHNVIKYFTNIENKLDWTIQENHIRRISLQTWFQHT